MGGHHGGRATDDESGRRLWLHGDGGGQQGGEAFCIRWAGCVWQQEMISYMISYIVVISNSARSVEHCSVTIICLGTRAQQWCTCVWCASECSVSALHFSLWCGIPRFWPYAGSAFGHFQRLFAGQVKGAAAQ